MKLMPFVLWFPYEERLIDAVLWPGQLAKWILIKTILFKQGITDEHVLAMNTLSLFVLDYMQDKITDLEHLVCFSVHNALKVSGDDI